MRFIAAVLVASLLATPTFAQELKALRSITVTGQAERKVVPDQAHLTVNLNAQSPKMATAKAEHDKKLGKLMDIVKGEGIDEKKMHTQSTSVQPVYSYSEDEKHKSVRHLDGYRVQSNIDITVNDTTKIATLLDKVTSADLDVGGNPDWGNLVNLSYTMADPNKLRDDMATDAIANAHDKADRMAKAAGATLGAVYQINEGATPSFNYPRPMPMMAMAKMSMAAAAPVAPPAGEEQVNASVTVTYELK